MDSPRVLSDLPADVLLHTLTFLPLRPLVQSLSVCRSFSALSSKPEFWRLVATSHFPPLLLPLPEEAPDGIQDGQYWHDFIREIWRSFGSPDLTPVGLFSEASSSLSDDQQQLVPVGADDDNARQRVFRLRVSLCGLHGSGKTCLFERFILDRFEPDGSTIAVDPPMKSFPLEEGQEEDQVYVEVWDYAGGMRLDRDPYGHRMVYRNAQLLYLCFRAGDVTSFLRLGGFLAFFDVLNATPEFSTCLRPENIVFVACQSDNSGVGDDSGLVSERDIRSRLWNDILIPLSKGGFDEFAAQFPKRRIPSPSQVRTNSTVESSSVLSRSSKIASAIVRTAKRMVVCFSDSFGSPEECVDFYLTSAREDRGVKEAFIERNRRMILRTFEWNRRWPDARIRECGEQTSSWDDDSVVGGKNRCVLM